MLRTVVVETVLGTVSGSSRQRRPKRAAARVSDIQQERDSETYGENGS